METKPDNEQLSLPQSELSPLDHHRKLKRLKKKSSEDIDAPSPPEMQQNETQALESDSFSIEDSKLGNESDGLDPLFPEGDQGRAKRVLEFNDLVNNGPDGTEDDLFGDEADFETETRMKKKRPIPGDFEDRKEKKNKKRTSKRESSEGKLKISKRKEKQERKAHLEQLADYQRVMRERKCVGFKPAPMVKKPISTVLEKIRQRKMEVSKKLMTSRSLQPDDSLLEVVLDDDSGEGDFVFETSDHRPKKAMSVETMNEPSATESKPSVSPVHAVNEPKLCSGNEQSSAKMTSLEKTAQLFRPPVDDTQDLFSDSQTSDAQDDRSNESDSLAEDVAPPLAPSLNLKFDSAFPDDISSEEESDKENIKPGPQSLFKGSSPPKGDPVKEFVDEEALEDDSDNGLMQFQDEDEHDDADVEEIHDYIATDCKEKEADHEKRNVLHQRWLQLQDEAGTENLLQRLKYVTKQKELSLLEDQDDGIKEDEDDYASEDTGDIIPRSSNRVTTKKLKQMIPQMFTDKDDGFISSEDEETERKLIKQRLLQNVELEERLKFLSPAEDETSKEVFGRIKKLNRVPETKRKPKKSSLLDSLFIKGSGNNHPKSSFLRRASSHPMTSSLKQGPSSGRSFIFGRDDSSSRSSISMSEEPSLGNHERQAKRSTAKFTSSQAKRNAQHAEIRDETQSGSSLFEILKCSSIKTGHSTHENVVDHQAVSAAFKSLKKSIIIKGGLNQGT